MKLKELIDGIDNLICINPSTLETYYEHSISLITQSFKCLKQKSEQNDNGLMFIMPTLNEINGTEIILDHTTINILLNSSLSALVVNDCLLINLLELAIFPVFKVLKIITTTNIIFGQLCNRYYNYPRRLIHQMIGVTGTNGKTTTTHMIEKVLLDAKLTVGLIGTLGYRYHGNENNINDYINTDYTTPNAWLLQTILNDMTNKYHIENIVIEVSSHSLILDRIYGCNFTVGILTNFTQDHLNFHQTMENYLQSKLLLFSKYLSKSSSSIAIINHDDPSYEYFINICSKNTKIYTYGLLKKNQNSFLASNIKYSLNGINYIITIPSGETRHVHLNIFGEYNVYNSLACIATCLTTYSHLLTLDQIIQSLEKFETVKGRFEFIICCKPFSVVVDYAHTPDALERTMKNGRQWLVEFNKNGRLIIVFGCGGNKDQLKRPLMGHVAEENADIIIITSDNPRQENPQSIIDDILSGIQQKIDNNRLYIELDREKAIHLAMDLAKNRNDLIIIAGKGHESTQILADHSIQFSDQEVVKNKYKQMMQNNF
ncbi:unnamed protein product [Rotaria sp. Silwood1]|nr:unnamed protein product [Rotaria sp. Silwood1]CAF3512372.1 unnamed protein product [Rotaria sp. Silwood1]CAF3606186.1 unnamed protein product [Rotaria sp. Silwood1]CAF4953026.1 unnamed protein product [Rotaria sp. Silwood1]CAF4964368.1 unnamed protein product [Rotaria sp. Silwood1]